jgi:hypothetical protein
VLTGPFPVLRSPFVVRQASLLPKAQGHHRFRLGDSLRRTYLRLRLPYSSRVDIAGCGGVNAAGGSERGFPAEVERRIAVPSNPSDRVNGPPARERSRLRPGEPIGQRRRGAFHTGGSRRGNAADRGSERAAGTEGTAAAGGGRSEVKRRRAGASHVEPRAESPLRGGGAATGGVAPSGIGARLSSRCLSRPRSRGRRGA